MKPFEIFKVGTHTASNGSTIEFTAEMLQAAVDAYDASLSEAPIVVGHPKENGPAYGWVKSLSFSGGIITAHPDQVDVSFSDMVQKGRFKKRSASWYMPDAKGNPKPGVLYLRHVGYLGAVPPAIKGLKDVNFSDDGEFVEFTDVSPYAFSTIGNVFRKIREWIISKDGLDAADSIIPSYAIDSMNEESARISTELQNQQGNAIYSETKEVETMSEDLTKKLADAEAEIARLKAADKLSADFSEKEKEISQREFAIAKKEIELKVDSLIKEGKVLPALKSNLVDFMASLSDVEASVDFSEDDKSEKLTQRAAFEKLIAAMPAVVNFGEESAPTKPTGSEDLTNEEIARKAAEFRDSEASKGVTISFTEAVAAVNSGKAN